MELCKDGRDLFILSPARLQQQLHSNLLPTETAAALRERLLLRWGWLADERKLLGFIKQVCSAHSVGFRQRSHPPGIGRVGVARR